jgi:MFS family permease
MLRGAVFGAAGISVQALMPLVARDLILGGPLTFGVLLGGFGIGAVGGAFLGGELRGRNVSSERIVQIAFLGSAVCAALTAISGSLALGTISMMIGGGSWVLALAGFNSAVQLSAPRWVVGRALALYQMATFGGMALGSWIWGVVAEDVGLSAALLWSAGALVAGAALGLRFRVPDVVAMNLDPRQWNEPSIELDIRPRSGPIVVTIEYVIRQQDVVQFLSVMATRRRIRLRDGAKHWHLLRDLSQPSIWIERYDTPTWQDYVRHNQRLTQADISISETLRDLHQGAEPPRVRRMIERQTTWAAAHDLPIGGHVPGRLRDSRGDALG